MSKKIHIKQCIYCKKPITHMDAFCSQCGRNIVEIVKDNGTLSSDYNEVQMNNHTTMKDP